MDTNHRPKRAKVQVACPAGLSAGDELYLWGLLALTPSQRDADYEFHATPPVERGCIERCSPSSTEAR